MIFSYILISLVLIFDFINGFRDTVNSRATLVSTNVHSAYTQAVMATFFNFISCLLFTLKVGTTIDK